MEAATDGGRIVDDATLRYLARVLARHRVISSVSVFPPDKQESIVVSLHEGITPPMVESAWLEFRLYTNGDFHLSSLEDVAGDIRSCRWDRHEQDHSASDHYHPLPSASTREAEDREFPADMVATLETVVFPWIDDRLGRLWEE